MLAVVKIAGRTRVIRADNLSAKVQKKRGE
jgi:hypothetical protein